jgi:uncharacterized protein YcbK (DUF882 family)
MKVILISFFCFSFFAATVSGSGFGEASAESTLPCSPKKKKAKARRCKAWASPGYNRMLRNWRKVPKIPKPRFRDGFRDLTVYAVNLGARIRVFPYLSDGSLDPDVIEEIENLFQDKDTGAEHLLNPRLIKLLYKLADYFKARQVNVISAYREASEWENGSNHSRGRAVDFMIPGVSLGALARRARKLGHVGVGLYPVSGFIHLDVRDGPSYFWIDRSGPGFPSCIRRIQDRAGAKSDRRWKPENDEPERRLNRKGIPLGAVENPAPEGESLVKSGCEEKSANSGLGVSNK